MTAVGVVTCGGLCPGLNNVIRGVVQELAVHYQVKRILGFRNGLRGLTAEYRDDTVDLTRRAFRDISHAGGTILGSSRGDQDADEMVDTLVARGIDILFVVGGDGSMRAAMRLVAAITRAGPRHRRHRDPQDHRQRPALHRPVVRLPERVRAGHRFHRLGRDRGRGPARTASGS